MGGVAWSESQECGGSSTLGVSCENGVFQQVLTAGGQATAPAVLVRFPDGMGGSYLAGQLDQATPLDVGCGSMPATSSAQGYVAHLDATGTCLFSNVLPVEVWPIVSDTHGVVLYTSSTTALDLGCGSLAAASGGSTFVTRLDPTGDCVFGTSLAAPGLDVALDPSGSVLVSGLVGATPIDLGGGPLAPLGQTDLVLGEIDVSGKYLWAHRFGAPASYFPQANASVTQAGNVYVWTPGGSYDLGGGVISGDLLVASFTSAGVPRWSRGVDAAGWYLAGLDACGSLVVATPDTAFDPGQGRLVPGPRTGPYAGVAVFRYAP